MRFFKMLKYYFFLLLKKIRFNIHDIFEKKHLIKSNINPQWFSIILWKLIFQNIRYKNQTVFIDTKVKNQNKPLILSQSRVLLSLVASYNNQESIIKDKWLIKSFSKYLMSERNKDGLYTFNYPFWDRQDEGIATVWVLLALIKSYDILKDEKILNFVEETTNIMIDELYSEQTSLLHTKDDDYWCLNAASTLAYLCKLILDIKYISRLELVMNNSISLCINNLAEDGHFPYSEKRPGTYLLLYHPVVIHTLEMCSDSNYLNKANQNTISVRLKTARDFLLKQMDGNYFFVEPEIEKYSRYIISNVTSLVALKGFISAEEENKILQNILKFMKDDKIFLCINNNLKLYNSSLYKLNDQLSIEVLFWLETYKSQ